MEWLKTIIEKIEGLFKWWVIVLPWEQGIRIRLGKRVEILNQGIHFRIPYIDSCYVHHTRLHFVNLSPQVQKQVLTPPHTLLKKIVCRTQIDQVRAIKYTGVAWKHHIADDYTSGLSPTHPNGAGANATIFLDYDKMLQYLQKDGRSWYAAELQLIETPIVFEFGNDYMATIQVDWQSEKGFYFCC